MEPLHQSPRKRHGPIDYTDYLNRLAVQFRKPSLWADDETYEAIVAGLVTLRHKETSGSLESVDCPWAFVVACVRNEILQARKRQRRFVRNVLARSRERPESTLPKNALVEREQSQLLRAAVRALSPRLRAVIVQSIIMGRTLREIEKRTGISKATLCRDRKCALRILHSRLSDKFPEF